MTRRNRPFIHVVDLNKENNKETMLNPIDIDSPENYRKNGKLYRLKSGSTCESCKKMGLHGSVNNSNPEIGTKRPRRLWYSAYDKNSFQSQTIQSSPFLPSFCYPIKITSQRGQKHVKRSKSETNIMTKADTSDCLIFEEKYLTDRHSNIMNIEGKNDFTPEKNAKDSSGFKTHLFERRKSNERTEPVTNESSVDECEQNRKLSETEYAIYDSSNSGPRIVRMKHDINFMSSTLTDDNEGEVFMDRGFQDVDLSLDPKTLNLSLDDVGVY
ncbi:uncharacterized protein LOC117324564 [Pecten maximus]|uniref:uncharacterized protein LOC117324564 n=1 Tax=Pecten maximus TaxID=6579 RepID=UPI001457F261|nr:uncharacterized protein LOC117324564 [Pecten maximus]